MRCASWVILAYAEGHNPNMKVALLLYGLFRHADVARFWRYAFPHGDIFVFSTFTGHPYTPRSQDKTINSSQVFRGIATAKHWSVVDQNTYDRSINLNSHITGAKDPWNSVNKTSLKNAVRVLFQLASLRDLFLTYDAGHTHLVLSRVDLLFVRPIRLHDIQHELVVPDYAHFGGKNDRFVAGPKDDVLYIMDRVQEWRRTSLLSEQLMGHMLRRKRHRCLHMGLTRRVRVGGQLVEAQYKFNPNTACLLDKVATMADLQPYKRTIDVCQKELHSHRSW